MIFKNNITILETKPLYEKDLLKVQFLKRKDQKNLYQINRAGQNDVISKKYEFFLLWSLRTFLESSVADEKFKILQALEFLKLKFINTVFQKYKNRKQNFIGRIKFSLLTKYFLKINLIIHKISSGNL